MSSGKVCSCMTGVSVLQSISHTKTVGNQLQSFTLFLECKVTSDHGDSHGIVKHLVRSAEGARQFGINECRVCHQQNGYESILKLLLNQKQRDLLAVVQYFAANRALTRTVQTSEQIQKPIRTQFIEH